MFNGSAQVHTEKTNKEGTTHSGATAPTERDYADKPTEHDTEREQDKISILRGSQNIHHNTCILHKTCLKHSNFLNRKILCTWNIMAIAIEQGTEETQRVETRFKIQHFQHHRSLSGPRSTSLSNRPEGVSRQ